MKARRRPPSSVLAVVLAGFLFFVLWERRDTEKKWEALREDAAFVSLGDKGRLRIRKSGVENAGLPIVLEAGIGGTSAQWAWLQQELSRDHLVLSYDRRGTGLSDGAQEGFDALTRVADLEALLEKTALPPPYILVGYDYGGVLVRLYQNLHPDKVAALFLIEPMHPYQDERLPKSAVDATYAFFDSIRRTAHFASFGMARFGPLPNMATELPPPEQDEMATLQSFDRHLLGVAMETDGVREGLRRAQALPPAESLPLGVASATLPPGEMTAKFSELSDDIARSSRRGFHALIDGAQRDTILNHVASASQIAADIRTLETMLPQGEAASSASP